MVRTRLMNEKTPAETVIKEINNNNNNNNNDNDKLHIIKVQKSAFDQIVASQIYDVFVTSINHIGSRY